MGEFSCSHRKCCHCSDYCLHKQLLGGHGLQSLGRSLPGKCLLSLLTDTFVTCEEYPIKHFLGSIHSLLPGLDRPHGTILVQGHVDRVLLHDSPPGRGPRLHLEPPDCLCLQTRLLVRLLDSRRHPVCPRPPLHAFLTPLL